MSGQREQIDYNVNKKGFRYNTPGVYVIHNKTKDKYLLIGSAVSHSSAIDKFVNKESPISTDLRMGDKFTIKFYLTVDSGLSLQQLMNEQSGKLDGESVY